MLNRELSRLLTQSPTESSGTWRALYRLDNEFVGFSGHFPDYPILPAFLQVEMAVHLLRAALDDELCLEGVSTAKFTGQARPGDCLEISCKPLPLAAEANGAAVQSWDCVIRTYPPPRSVPPHGFEQEQTPEAVQEAASDAPPAQIAKFRLNLSRPQR